MPEQCAVHSFTWESILRQRITLLVLDSRAKNLSSICVESCKVTSSNYGQRLPTLMHVGNREIRDWSTRTVCACARWGYHLLADGPKGFFRRKRGRLRWLLRDVGEILHRHRHQRVVPAGQARAAELERYIARKRVKRVKRAKRASGKSEECTSEQL